MKPELLFQANHSLGFIFKCIEVYREDKSTPLSQIMDEYVHGGNTTLLNPGLAIAISYIYFVYPMQVAANLVDSLIDQHFMDFSKFKQTKGVKEKEKGLARRIKNSLVNGNFDYDEATGKFIFWDNNKEGNSPFEAKIKGPAFAEFVEEFGKVIVLTLLYELS